jgi:NAD(P)-dependent dehydrogenase (short-subunit alcohol dehydrogenase family)
VTGGSPAVVVTAGASGVGEAIVRHAVARGARVAVTDGDTAGLERLRAELGDRVFPIVADATSEGDVAAAARSSRNALGPIDQLYIVAGGGRGFGPLVDLDVADWDFTMALTLRSCFLTLKYVAPEMVDDGAIVTIASINSHVPFYRSSAYSTAKAGVEMLTKNAALDFGPRLRVNAVLPGIVRTASTVDFTREGSEELRDYTERSVLGRIADPDDIALPALFLGSADARHITGASLVVDAGTEISGYPDPRRLRLATTAPPAPSTTKDES